MNRRHKSVSKKYAKVKKSELAKVQELVRQTRFPEAASQLESMLERQPDNPELLQALGQTLLKDGKADRAIRVLEQAMLCGESATLWNDMGIAHRALGEVEEAVAAFRRAIALRRGFSEAYLNLSDSKRFTDGDEDLESLRKAASGAQKGQDAIRLQFALAKAFDDLQEYDTAYTHLERGNALKRKTFEYNSAHIEALIEQTKAVFSNAFWGKRRFRQMLDSLQLWKHTDKSTMSPIFIVGMPRSGTTLIEQMLASHGELQPVGERNEFKDLVVRQLQESLGAPDSPAYPQAAMLVSPSALQALAGKYLESVTGGSTGVRIVDKTPMNFLFVGLIRLIWPDAKVIYCDRHPMATCFSCYQRLFSGDQPFAYDQVELGEYYRNFASLMQHWMETLPDVVLRVRYEEVVENPEREIRRVLSHCKLPWSDQCLEFYRTDRTILTASALQVRKPMYTSSLEHWKKYENHLKDLESALQDRAVRQV